MRGFGNMPVEFTSASVGETAKEPDFVVIDEAGLPTQVMDSREHFCRPSTGLICARQDGDGIEFAVRPDSRALRTVGTYIFLRTLMRTVERSHTAAQALTLKKTTMNPELQETMRVCEAYRVTDNVDDLQNGLPHRIDMIV